MASEQNWLDYDVETMVAGDKNSLWHHLKSHTCFKDNEQMIVVGGEGLKIRDIRGNEYLDATSGGVWSVMVGYGRESIARAVYEQLKEMPYFAGAYGTIPSIKFASKLLELLPRHDKIYFSNSGSEANEKAFKMVRLASRIDPARKGKYKILYRDRDYHGTTVATMSACGQFERKKGFGPFVEGFPEVPHCLCYRCPFDKTYPGCDIECARAVEEVILKEGPDTVGGFIVEPITAGGGIIPPVKEYFPIVQEICKKYGVWIIMDEVVCGFGRTGKFWGHEHYDVDPDIVTMAKGLASSYEALSATAVKQEIFDIFLNDTARPEEQTNYFRDISTYGGCTAPMAAALESTRIIEDENLVENSRKMGELLLEKLKGLAHLPNVGDVRGVGLFCGLEIVLNQEDKAPPTEQQMAKLMGNIVAEKVIVGRTNSSLPGLNTTLYFVPCLTVTEDELDTIVAAVEKGIQQTF
ncbi:taurine-pyruvate aminotransferase [Desulfocicer vacuolatum DSM 3385]|uniref:Taurine-pyruvate aminotransferase n=1 Tax=Desulfocicer vacuolatum DSM 3385 TaxID=1121400 RepID=A0A1W2DLQ6_9BACT|nr:aminotransferase class III-fold pyridoxal phosphate-dependent enzyme [Desulfocicer vacuolatum]SMC98379.1 taurine-pyruvate aminotransferase [Desulfocicer vacuolatum DSM 3385]